MGEQQERNKALVRETIDKVWNAHDGSAVERYYAADCRYADPGNPAVTDRAGIAAMAGGLGASFTDLRFTVDELVAEGDKVVKRFTLTGMHTGDFNGIPATGRPVRVTAMTIYTIRDGLIVDGVSVGDNLGFMAQLGLLPEPASAS